MAASSVPLPPPMSATVRIAEKSYAAATLGANAAVRSDIAAWNCRARSGFAARNSNRLIPYAMSRPGLPVLTVSMIGSNDLMPPPC